MFQKGQNNSLKSQRKKSLQKSKCLRNVLGNNGASFDNINDIDLTFPKSGSFQKYLFVTSQENFWGTNCTVQIVRYNVVYPKNGFTIFFSAAQWAGPTLSSEWAPLFITGIFNALQDLWLIFGL